MKRPVSVFVCGVQKGGTTSLHRYFEQHPGMSAPAIKELHYFSNDTVNWEAPDYAHYQAFFPVRKINRLRFDITPAYGFCPAAIARIADYNPDAKLIYLFRDPFDRAYSHWCMQYARGRETMLFSDALRDGRKRLDGLPWSRQLRWFSYVERGYYAEQVGRALDHFPRENVLFLRSTDLLKNHAATLARIAGFLKIAPFEDADLITVHKRATIEYPSKKTEQDRRLVADLLGAEMEAFSAMTGLDISDWATMRRELVQA